MLCFLYFLLAELVAVTMAKPLELSGTMSSTVALPLIASVVVTICVLSVCLACKKKPTKVSPEMKKDRNSRRTSIVSGTFSVQSEDLTPVNTTNFNTDTKSKTITRKISHTERVRVKQPDTIFE